ncbi:MAG: HAMP domain-containing histidine kinase [Clostridiales bacterium]|nr:HAMP domain-containing histidine kinase [Clostridiales bacterium]MDD7433116.1 HAMP domain-containing sensor histidine kinase [Clostridiales bacterium]MDY3061993.1 HAMP domain-containing sensor histidine kinase [Eubacteriales bacterium]
MKRLSLQWRMTLMTALLICLSCVAMQLLLGFSGIRTMDRIGESIQGYSNTNEGETAFFDPEAKGTEEGLTIIIQGAQTSFFMSSWLITAAVTVLSGILAWFVSGHALKPLHSFVAQVEKVQLNNLSDMKINEDLLPEFQQLGRSFNQMLERLNHAFAAQRQFTGNAAHELRTPLALLQAQIELFSAEHPDLSEESRDFLRLLREQTERMSQMTGILLEMSHFQNVERKDTVQLQPMIEEIFTDLTPLAEKNRIHLESEGDACVIGSDPLIYRLLFNLCENAIKYNRQEGSVRVSIVPEEEDILVRVRDSGKGIPAELQQSIFQPFFRVEQSRSRDYGGVGLGLSLVWEIARLHGGSVQVETSSTEGTCMLLILPRA